MRPNPKVVSGPAGPRSRAVLVSKSSTWVTLKAGLADRMRATQPAVCGLAIDVPLIVLYPPLFHAERILYPGELTSGLVSLVSDEGPRLLKLAIASLLSVAPLAKLSA